MSNGQFNPDWNRFNVAPVGPNIIIGHKRALQGGVSREDAVNLIAALILVTKASQEEIGAELRKAHAATPSYHPSTTAVPARTVTPQAAPQPAPQVVLGNQRPSPTLAQGNQRPSPTLFQTTGQGPNPGVGGTPAAYVAKGPAPSPVGQPPVGASQRPSPRLRPDLYDAQGNYVGEQRQVAPAPVAPAPVVRPPAAPVVASKPVGIGVRPGMPRKPVYTRPGAVRTGASTGPVPAVPAVPPGTLPTMQVDATTAAELDAGTAAAIAALNVDDGNGVPLTPPVDTADVVSQWTNGKPGQA